MYLLVPVIVIRLLLKSRRLKAYRQRISERFCIAKNLPGQVDVWLHAVSMGEVVAATPLIERMLAQDLCVLVTTMTPTGSQQVINRFDSRVSHQYLPYDLPWCLQRFFKRTRPRIGIIMETELWPNLIYFAHKNNVPMILVNARLSDHAFEQYKKLKWLLSPILSLFHWIGAQSEQDAKRYQTLGALPSKLEMVGNMKFDLAVTPGFTDALNQLKLLWGKERPVWIVASTHDDEETQLLSQLARIQSAIPDIIVLIAPRRPERFQTVYDLVQQQGWRAGLRSRSETINRNCEIIVLDTMGELMNFYALSDFAFVGGSLVPIGGHNVLEPIAMQVPTLCGPFMQNAKAICDDLVAKQGLYRGQSAADLADKLIVLHQNPAERQSQMTNATAVLKANRGAIDRYWLKIQGILALSDVTP